jgi:hypothetical protein
LVVELFFAIGARARVIFGIKGTTVQIGANSGIFINAGIRGYFGIPYILEIGLTAYLDSSLNANALVSAGFDQKFYTKIFVDIDL